MTRHSRSPSAAARFVEFDDIGEHHRRQNPVHLHFVTRSGQELLDLARNPIEHVMLTREHEVVIDPWQLDIFGAGDVRRQIAAAFDADHAVANPVHDQRRHPDGWQNMAAVDFLVHAADRDHRRRASARALQASRHRACRLFRAGIRRVTP